MSLAPRALPVGRPPIDSKSRGGQVAVTCARCGHAFTKYRCNLARRNYCTPECQRLDRRGENNPHWRGGDVQLSCEHCGKAFAQCPARGQMRFCSPQCRYEGQRIYESAAAQKKACRRRRDLRLRNARCEIAHTEAEWRTLLSRHDGRCAHCGTAEDITRDHIIPISKGGTDDIGNIQPLCRPCNSRKSDSL